MKCLKRSLSFALVLCLCLMNLSTAMHVDAAEIIQRGTCGGSLQWELSDDGVLRIFGGGAIIDTMCTNPSPFESIAGKVKTAILEEGVTAIGMRAFQACTKLTRVEIPDTVTLIADCAFRYASHLVNIEIPAGVQQMNSGVFQCCWFLKHIWFSGDAPSMHSLMLEETYPLTAYYPASNPTWTADKLQNYGGSVTWVPVETEEGCEILGFGRIGEDVHWSLYSNGLLKIFGEGEMWNYENATDLPWWDIRTEIQRAEIAPGVTSLSDYTFCRCTALTEVTIPASVARIGTQAFSGSGITNVILDPENADLCCVDNVVYSKDMTELVAMPGLYSGHYVLPETVCELSAYEFAHQTAMTGVTLHRGLTRIDTAAFWDCTVLTEVTIPANVNYIGYYAFRDCSALQRICFQGEAPEIEYNAFYDLELDCYYPENLSSWENNIYWDYSGWINWIPYDGQHSYSGKIIAPTCTDAGYTHYSCAHCGDSYRADEVPALGHAFVNGICIRCGLRDETDASAHPFVDVMESDYFLEPVLWAVENGITSGTGNGKFSPEDTCTRAQVVTFLWRACGKPAPASDENPFTDVPADAYYYDAVLWAVENGITSGTGNGKFSPEDSCTRGQVVTFLWRAMGKAEPETEENPFGDVTAADYFYNPVLWAVENGITAGTGAGTFSPETDCTRGQVVTFLYRCMADE